MIDRSSGLICPIVSAMSLSSSYCSRARVTSRGVWVRSRRMAPSLREAITLANTAAGADTIAFDVPGAGVQTITPLSALPAVTDIFQALEGRTLAHTDAPDNIAWDLTYSPSADEAFAEADVVVGRSRTRRISGGFVHPGTQRRLISDPDVAVG